MEGCLSVFDSLFAFLDWDYPAVLADWSSVGASGGLLFMVFDNQRNYLAVLYFSRCAVALPQRLEAASGLAAPG